MTRCKLASAYPDVKPDNYYYIMETYGFQKLGTLRHEYEVRPNPTTDMDESDIDAVIYITYNYNKFSNPRVNGSTLFFNPQPKEQSMSNPTPVTKAPFSKDGYQFIQFCIESEDIACENSIAIIWIKCTKEESYTLQRKFVDFVGNKISSYDHADDAVYDFMDKQEDVEWGFLPLDYVDF